MIFLPIGINVVLPVNSVPLTQSDDFTTVKEDVAWNETNMELHLHRLTLAGAVSVTDFGTDSGAGPHSWVHQGHGMYTVQMPLTTPGTILNNTIGYGYVTGKCDGVLAWRGPTIGFGIMPANWATTIAALEATQALIVADTGELQTDWAAAGRLEATLALIVADTGELQTDWADGGRLEDVLDTINTAAVTPVSITTEGENIVSEELP